MPYNLLIVDYGLGHPGSIHDTYVFQEMEVGQHLEAQIPEGHWIWVDSAYPTRPWYIVPFKTTWAAPLSWSQKIYNRHLSRVRAVMTCPYSFVSQTYLFFFHNYSSIPHHQPADSTCFHNCFLPSASLDFFDSFPLTHVYFFMIPSHSIMFYLLCHCSGLPQVSDI